MGAAEGRRVADCRMCLAAGRGCGSARVVGRWNPPSSGSTDHPIRADPHPRPGARRTREKRRSRSPAPHGDVVWPRCPPREGCSFLAPLPRPPPGPPGCSMSDRDARGRLSPRGLGRREAGRGTAVGAHAARCRRAPRHGASTAFGASVRRRGAPRRGAWDGRRGCDGPWGECQETRGAEKRGVGRPSGRGPGAANWDAGGAESVSARAGGLSGTIGRSFRTCALRLVGSGTRGPPST